MAGKLVVFTGLDGSGTSSIAEGLCKRDPEGFLMKTPDSPFDEYRLLIDDSVRMESPAAHYLFYLASVVHASSVIEEKLKTHNVYCVRYLIDSVVSHRVMGLNIELEYSTPFYSIVVPDQTFFVLLDETVRQKRISHRGKSTLDRVLDDDTIRGHFLDQFARYEDHYCVIENTSNDISTVIKQAASCLPWLKHEIHV